jgi:hypothetical protein
VNGFYSSLKNGNLLGGRYQIYNDVRGENFLNETNNGVTALLIWNFAVTGSDAEINNTWNNAYATINNVNIFLDGMEKEGNAVVGDDLARQYAGEAKFVRALAYYSLLQLYAQPYTRDNGASPGLPLRLTPIVTAGYNDLARSSVADVYKQIISDLNDAEANLPDDYGDDATNTTHAHINTAIALKVRAYLSMGDWDHVISEADKIVPATAPFKAPAGVPFALQSDIRTVFSNYTTTESILSMPFTGANEQPGTQNQLAYYYLPGDDHYDGDGEYSLNDKGIIGDSVNFKVGDARRSFIYTDADIVHWLTKYPGGSPYLDWAPVMRYSEVLLALAEARTKSTHSVDAQAIALLNAVHGRSDPSTTFTSANFSDANALADAIIRERNIEFLGEGIRGTDITRLGLTFLAKGAVKAVAPSDPAYIFPAPTSETQYNHSW